MKWMAFFALIILLSGCIQDRGEPVAEGVYHGSTDTPAEPEIPDEDIERMLIGEGDTVEIGEMV